MSAPQRLSASPLANAAVASIVAIVVLAIVTTVEFFAWQRNAVTAERLDDAHDALVRYRASMQTAESAVRGFLITGHADDLAAFSGALDQAEKSKLVAQSLLAGDSLGLTRLTEAVRIGESTSTGWRRMILGRETRTDGPREGAPIEARAANVSAMLDPLIDRVSTGRSEAAASARQLRTAFVASSILVALAVAAAIAALWRTVVRERRARAELVALHEREAKHDPVTHLPNRRFFSEWAGYTVAGCQRDGDGFGLLLIGVESGDVKLRTAALAPEIARRLRSLKRGSDFLGHIEGTVFALAALHVLDRENLSGLAERILRALTHPPLPGSKLVPIAPCIGVAMFPDDAGDLPGLFAAADSALSSARHAGGNRVVFHGVEMPVAAAAR